ncbi:hypothetical protein PWT90_07202 [Aphanocladium album]|nr:hypothetical protein PWT90_07202 [Aphanocladium album]
MKFLAFVALATAVAATDYVYWSGSDCTGHIEAKSTFPCGVNTLPRDGPIRGINVQYSQGNTVYFHQSQDCSGVPWFDMHGDGCVSDAAGRTGCIYIPC